MEPVLQCQQCRCRLALQDDALRSSSGSGSRLDESWLLEEGGPTRSQQGAGSASASGSGSAGVAGGDLAAAGALARRSVGSQPECVRVQQVTCRYWPPNN